MMTIMELVQLQILILTFTTTAVLSFQTFKFPNKQINFFGDEIIKKLSISNPFISTGTINNKQRQRVSEAVAVENALLQLIDQQQDENGNDTTTESQILELITKLECNYTDVSITEPAIANEIYGRWKLIYSTKPKTASPIQRTAFGKKSKFPIYQDIVLTNTNKNSNNKDTDDNNLILQVNQVIDFGNNYLLSVDAVASTGAYPLLELTERKGTGKVFGLNLLGVSMVGTEAEQIRTSNGPNSVIDFVFDQGNFYLPNNITIPYPVPFRLPILRDTVKGWIAITYLSPNSNNINNTGRLRISRGNKGTAFVLQKVS